MSRMSDEKSRNCYIIGAGEFYGFRKKPCRNDYIIAADGGYGYLQMERTEPHLVIGDFDSIKEIPHHPNLIVLPKDKDDTDTMAAVREGLKEGCHTFHIYGGTGGRMDHTLANIQILSYLSIEGKQGFLYGHNYTMTTITDNSVSFGKEQQGFLSIFAQSEKARGVTLQGLKYGLDQAVITNQYPIGISNEFVGKESSITVEKGTLLLYYENV